MKLLRLKGGLGNQIFQVVHLLLSSSKKESLFVDVSIFGRKFAADYAGANILVDQVLNKAIAKRIKYINISPKLSSLVWKLGNYFKSIFLDDYFSNISLFPQELDYKQFFNLECSYPDITVDANSVLIHVRKGDYTNSENAKIYFNCEPDYFAKAVELISQKIDSPKFFIMSNDNSWVKENFTFLSDYKILEIEDPILSFKVMNKFSNFIISNSTFSWWPAFITKSKNVYAPKKWYLDDKKNINLYPNYWTKV
jgi:hypothetical protein